MEEIENTKWTPIPGFDKYYISEDGKVLSRKRKNPKILQQMTCNNVKNTTVSVKLGANGKYNLYLISFLMATTFIENPYKYTLIRYKDGNNLNYHINNLEWSNNPFNSKDTWEVIKNFPNYEICEQGSVRNMNTKQILSIIITDTYPSLTLVDVNGYPKTVYVHVLIAKQYIENPFNLPQVNHIDGNKMNFSINNLEWMTNKQNCQHAYDIGLNTGARGKGKLVELLDENYRIIDTFTSMLKACDFFNITKRVLEYNLKKNVFGDGTALINSYRIRLKINHDLEGEVWKSVNVKHDYIDTHYEVSSHGRVRHINKECIRSASMKGDYRRMCLYDGGGGKGKHFYIHRLVAFAFQSYEGNQSDYDVDHIHKNPSYNYECNLAIMKRKEHMIKDQGTKVLSLSNDNKYLIFNSYGLAGKFIGKDSTTIGKAIIRKHICGNYKWFKLSSEEAQKIITNDNYELILHD